MYVVYAVGLTNTSCKDPESHTVPSASDLAVWMSFVPLVSAGGQQGAVPCVSTRLSTRPRDLMWVVGLDHHVTKYMAPSQDT